MGFSLNLLLTLALFSPKASAEEPFLNRNKLLVMSGKGQIQLLNQKLVYGVEDNRSVIVGNLKISESNLKISIDGDGVAKLEAPLQFIVGGKLVLKDPQGRALWDTEITDPSQVTIKNGPNDSSSQIRETSAHYTLDISRSLENKLRQVTFFTFCTYIETKKNRIQACAPAQALNPSSDAWTLTPINRGENEATILVNDVEVNDHGVIQFDKNIKTVSLAVILPNGMSVEARTDYIPLNTYNLLYLKESDTLEMTLQEKPQKGKKTFPWETKVPLGNPSLFVEALGQVPLKQEFTYQKEALPTETTLPTITEGNSRTYGSDASLELQLPSDLVPKPKTKGDAVIPNGDGQFTWVLDNLSKGINPPHLLALKKDKQESVAIYQMERLLPWALSVRGGQVLLNQINQVASAQELSPLFALSLERYFTSFFGSHSSLHFLRWGLFVEATQLTQDKTPVNSNLLGISYRFTPSYHHFESSASLRLSMFSLQQQQTQIQFLGLGWSYEGSTKILQTIIGDQFIFKGDYFPSASGADPLKISIMDLSWESRYLISRAQYWSWMLQWKDTATVLADETTKSSQQRATFYLGWGGYF